MQPLTARGRIRDLLERLEHHLEHHEVVVEVGEHEGPGRSPRLRPRRPQSAHQRGPVLRARTRIEIRAEPRRQGGRHPRHRSRHRHPRRGPRPGSSVASSRPPPAPPVVVAWVSASTSPAATRSSSRGHLTLESAPGEGSTFTLHRSPTADVTPSNRRPAGRSRAETSQARASDRRRRRLRGVVARSGRRPSTPARSTSNVGGRSGVGIDRQVVERPERPGLGVGGAEDHALDPRRRQGAGAHGAGLEGDHDGGAGQPPRAGRGARVAQGQELGVGGWVLVASRRLWARATTWPSTITTAPTGTSSRGREPGLVEGEQHGGRVDSGVRARRGTVAPARNWQPACRSSHARAARSLEERCRAELGPSGRSAGSSGSPDRPPDRSGDAIGGGSGIRTHGGLRHTRFPSVPIRPLSQPSSGTGRIHVRCARSAGGGRVLCNRSP